MLRLFPLALAAFLVVLLPSAAFAHPGGTDASGCHTDHSTGARHCHSGTGGGSGSFDPMILNGIGYGITGLGAMFTFIGFAGEGQLNDLFTYSMLLYAASELLAIVAVAALPGDPVHVGVLTGLNLVGAIAGIVGLVVYSGPPAPTPPYQVSIGPGGVSISGVF